MPIAKTANIQATTAKPVTHSEAKPQVYTSNDIITTDGEMAYKGVPIDLFRYFNIDLKNCDDKDCKRMSDVYEWAKNKVNNDEKSLGQILSKISSLDMKLGVGHLTERRIDKLWNWVKLSNQISELETKRNAYEFRGL